MNAPPSTILVQHAPSYKVDTADLIQQMSKAEVGGKTAQPPLEWGMTKLPRAFPLRCKTTTNDGEMDRARYGGYTTKENDASGTAVIANARPSWSGVGGGLPWKSASSK